LSVDDNGNAVENSLAGGRSADQTDFVMLVGLDQSGNMIEVGIVVTDDVEYAVRRAPAISRVTTYTRSVGRESKPLGDVDTSILAVLAGGDLHGYAILAEVRALSDGGVRLGTGTMYGALERLQDNGMVRVAAEDVVDGRTRRYYRLTDAGRRALVAELERRDQLLNAARRRLAGAT
jgi:DNA-binding PadR family transcriptional regulator